MDPKSLSLSKKLDGGYLHVKKRDSNVKKRVGGNKTSPKRLSYSNYLQRIKGGNSANSANSATTKNTVNKVVSVNMHGSKKRGRNRSPTKKDKNKKHVNKSPVKDISETPIIPVVKPAVKPVVKPVVRPAVKPVVKPAVKPVVKPAVRPVVKPAVRPVVKPAVRPVVKPAVKPVVKPAVRPVVKPVRKGVPLQMPKTKGSLKKGKVVKRGGSSVKKRSTTRSLTRRRTYDPKKGKRISLTKTRKLSNKDVQSIQSKLKDIKKKSTEEIKKELDKEGIQVSGKSPSILKDIYMYSKLCGINIKRE